jgi:alkyl hydroperoxide reductase subunit AhpC
MGLRLGDTAPDFTQESTQGTIHFHDWINNSWAVLFSHPADFTPVCTTELGAVARLNEKEFAKRGVKVIAVSVDPVSAHNEWIKDINETQKVNVNYPILGDADHKVSEAYDMLHPGEGDSSAVRSLFIIDPKKKIRAIITYPKSAGRNFTEILRVIDSLQLTDKHSVATPADWKSGDDVVIVPSLTDPAELKKRFPKGYKEVKPYLRTTPQPDK